MQIQSRGSKCHLAAVNMAGCIRKQTTSFICGAAEYRGRHRENDLAWTLEGGPTPVTHLHSLSNSQETGVRTLSTAHTLWLILT